MDTDERNPPQEDTATTAEESLGPSETEKAAETQGEHKDEAPEEAVEDVEEVLTPAALQARLEECMDKKNKGNDFYKQGDFVTAVEFYTEAISLCPKGRPELSSFYGNRAACYTRLEEHEKCIEDCTKALAIEPGYVKVLHRRAAAHERLDQLQEALDDFKEVLKHDPTNKDAKDAARRLPGAIEAQRERLKDEMLSKLKELGNMCLRPFGLSTNNFQMVKDPNTGSYSINFNQKA